MSDDEREVPKPPGGAPEPPPSGAAEPPAEPPEPATEPAADEAPPPSADAVPPEPPPAPPVPAAAEPAAPVAATAPAAPPPAAAPPEGEPGRAPTPPALSPPAHRPSPPPRVGPWGEGPEVAIEVPRRRLAAQSRRDFLLFTAGVLGTAVMGWWLVSDRVRARFVSRAARERLDTLAGRVGLSSRNRERALDQALSFDDDVAEALYSKERRVRTYRKSQVTPLRINYHGRTPGPEYLATWKLQLSGLASGRTERLAIEVLRARFPHREQVTRLVCVEGWSAVAWWGGLRFADLLQAYPPAPGARWAALRSMVSLDPAGLPEPYYVSIDLGTARHPQTLLATHLGGRPLPLVHGAPLRLLAPMKLGLKNIKAITDITYTAEEPADYWAERGYSKYDGL